MTAVTPEVLETDDDGNPIVVVFRESEAEREARQAERVEQAERAQEVAKSLAGTAHDTLTLEDSASVKPRHPGTVSDHLELQDSVGGQRRTGSEPAQSDG